MRNQKLICIACVLILCLCIFTACGDEVDADLHITITFMVDGEVYHEMEVKNDSRIKFPDKPTKEGYVFDGWYLTEDYKGVFSTIYLTQNEVTTDLVVYAKWAIETPSGGQHGSTDVDDDAKITGILGGDVEGLIVNLDVSSAIIDVDLSGMITVSEGSSWQLYADKTGQTNIPTKIAADLVDGENIFYIVVNSEDNKINRTYTVKIWKNFNVTVRFYAFGYEIHSVNKETHTWITDEDFPDVNYPGYRMVGWAEHKAGEEHYIDDEMLNANERIIKFNAVLEGLKHTISFDGNGVDCDLDDVEVTYGSSFVLPTLTREGYTFDGWEYDGKKITNAKGYKINSYSYAENVNVKARWIINSYTTTATSEGNYGIATSSGTKEYGTSAYVIATPYRGYVFDGWYDGERKVSSESTYAFSMPAHNVNLVAKWSVAPEMENFIFTSSSTTCKINGVKDKTMTYIVLPDYVTSIGATAFENCSRLLSITIPESCTSIGTLAFNGCPRLVEVFNKSKLDIVAGGETYGYIAYYALNVYTEDGGSNLLTDEDGYVIYSNDEERILVGYIGNETELVIPSNVTKINNFAFFMCAELSSVDMKEGIVSIGRSAFYGCENLTTIVVPDSVSSIDSAAFCKCDNLQSITIPFVGAMVEGTENTHFGHIFGAYLETENSTYVPSSLKEVTVTGGSRIKASAFYGCSGLTSILISGSVTSIGSGAFDGCSSLEQITIPFVGAMLGGTENSHFGYIFGASKSQENAEFVPTSLEKVVILEIIDLGDGAFYGCSRLKEITMPSTMKTMGDSVFHGCSNLISVSIPENVTGIGRFAFNGCSKLTNISIPKSVTSIGAAAFQNCSSLLDIIIPEGVTYIGDHSFFKCASLESVTIARTVTTIDQYAFEYCVNLEEVFYTGTKSDWYGITIGSRNVPLTDATRYYYSECIHDNNHWRYDSAGNISTALTVGEWVVDTEPTCTTNGSKHGVCNVCGETVTSEIPALGHNIGDDGTCTVCGEEIPLYTITNDATYAFVETDGVLQSTNHADNSSSSYVITATKTITITFEYNVSSESNYDKFYIYHNTTQKVVKSGTSNSYTSYSITLNAGDTLTFMYTKDSSSSSGDDCCYIKNLTITPVNN